jgi:glutamyl-tRNA reductase
MVPVESLEFAIAQARHITAGWTAATQWDNGDVYPWSELVLLATCNRVEVWVSGQGDGSAARDFLRAEFGLATDGAGPETLYAHTGCEAVRHLCRVAAGLDSMVLGEPQIAGQVARAFRMPVSRNGSAPMLPAMARIATKVSRRARAETGISRGPASVSSLAVHLAVEAAGGLAGKHVLVLGAGKMSRLACTALAAATEAGTRITVVNRTLERAEALAARVAGGAARLVSLPDLLVTADVVLASTAASEPLIDERMLSSVMSLRSARPLIAVDIAVPRNIDPGVRAVDNVHLFGIDELRSQLASHLDERMRHVSAVEAIVDEEVCAWGWADEVSPVLAALYQNAEQLRRRETTRALSSLAGADEHVIARMEQLSRTLVRRLLHEPAQCLRSEAEPEQRQAYARAARALFGLEVSNGKAAS